MNQPEQPQPNLDPGKEFWFKNLQHYSKECRKSTPIQKRSTLSEEEEWQCRLIGGDIIGWWNERLQQILAERSVIKIMGLDPNPVIVITTTMPGMIACREIFSEPRENLILLLEDEFQEWKRKNHIVGFKFHVHHWNHFSPSEIDLKVAIEKYPSAEGQRLYMHHCGDQWGDRCGIFVDHLWAWDGHEMNLLKECFMRGMY